jgi:hypothetical protein
MAKIVFAMNQSLDGYVEHTNFLPSPALFRHFIEQVPGLAGIRRSLSRSPATRPTESKPAAPPSSSSPR